MSFLAGVAVGVVAGTGVATVGTWRVLTARYDLDGYRRRRLADTRVREVYANADHEHRLACRWERRAVEARAQIGELCLALARRDRQLARLTRPRHLARSPIPTYGTHRKAAA